MNATAAVLITVLDGTADYVSAGDVNVVLVDFDRYELDTAFPNDFDRDIQDVRALAPTPWTDEVLRRLLELQRRVFDEIRSAPPPPGGRDSQESDPA